MNDVLFSSKSEEWETPQKLFDELNQKYHFTVDVCATNSNHKVDNYYTKEDDGLTKTWGGLCGAIRRMEERSETGYKKHMKVIV